MKTNYMISVSFCAALVALTSCSMMPKKSAHVKHVPDMYAVAAESSSSFVEPGALPHGRGSERRF